MLQYAQGGSYSPTRHSTANDNEMFALWGVVSLCSCLLTAYRVGRAIKLQTAQSVQGCLFWLWLDLEAVSLPRAPQKSPSRPPSNHHKAWPPIHHPPPPPLPLLLVRWGTKQPQNIYTDRSSLWQRITFRVFKFIQKLNLFAIVEGNAILRELTSLTPHRPLDEHNVRGL